MSDPKRLLEENNDEFENELLRSVRVDGMNDRNRQRILAGIGLATAGLTASTAAASTSATGAAVKAGFFKGVSAATVKWIAICSLATLIPTGVWVARSQRTVSFAPSPAATTPATLPPTRAVEPPSAPVDNALPADESVPEAKAPATQAAQPAASSTLADEVAALQVARTALAAHDPNGAIVALDRYKSRFPAGKLGPEATFLRIDALNQRGDRAAAAAMGDRFLAAHPRSPYADRVRSILSASKGAAKDAPSR
jgi:Outer membrane lipoprotein